MDDSREWATSWLAHLVGPGAQRMARPVVVHDRQCAGLAPAQLPEQLRELRNPVADGVPKNGRYAVVYERRWNDRDTVWLEAAEYAFGMFGARFVMVVPVRRTGGGGLIGDGEPRELTEVDLAPPPATDRGATARAVAASALAGAREGWAALRRAGENGLRRLRERRAGPADESPEPAGAGDGRSLRERLAGTPTALIVAVWVGVLLVGAVSAVSLAGLVSSSPSASGSGVSEHAAGQVVPIRPAATAVPAPGPNPAAAQATKPGDLGLSVPISRPACDGGYGVIVANATRPGTYQHEISAFLGRYAGASYLLAEQACSSLRSHTGDGSSIYAVYYGPYPALDNACETRRRMGGGSYVRKLENGGPSTVIIRC